jgi:hypothetical protein
MIVWRDPKKAEEAQRKWGWSRTGGLIACVYRLTTQRERFAAELYALTEVHRLKRCPYRYSRKLYRAIWMFDSLRKRNAYYDELVIWYGDLPVEDLDRYADLAKQHGNLGPHELDKRANLAKGTPVGIGAKGA